MSFKKLCASVIVLILPWVLLQLCKRGDGGLRWSTPSARQWGDMKAPVTIVEYSDFQCPMCGRVQPQLRAWLETYKGKVKLYFKHYPLTQMHKNALPAAIAAECAGEQKQFWPYSERLYERQSQWAALADGTTHYVALAEELKLNVPQFSSCRQDPAITERIMRDVEEGNGRAVNATPTFFIDGERLVGTVFATDGALTIERALRRKS